MWLCACPPRQVHETASPPVAEVVSTPPPPATSIPAPAIPAPLRAAIPEPLRRLIHAVAGATLSDVRSRSACQGPLCLVEVALSLANPRDRIGEADLELRLPRDARVIRLALTVAGVLREAAVVPRPKAVEIYDTIVRSLRDPALLERNADESLRLRVAPIPAQSATDVVFSYVELTGAAHSKDRWIARVQLPEPPRAPTPRRLRVLLDTSASMDRHFPEHLARARELLAALAANHSTNLAAPVALELVAFDQTIQVVHDGPLTDIPEQVWTDLRTRGALGATRLAPALRARHNADQILVLTDGAFTDGDAALRASGKAMAAAGVERLDVVSFAEPTAEPSPGLALLRDRARLALPRRGVVTASTSSLATTVRRLVHAVHEDVPLDVRGATWWSPRTVDLGNDDDTILLVARSSTAPVPTLRNVAGRDIPLPLAAKDAPGPLFDRLWLALQIDAELAIAGTKPAALAAMAKRSAKLGVLTPLTAFLALESDKDEMSFGVRRRRDAPIVTIDGDAVVLRDPAADDRAAPGRLVGVHDLGDLGGADAPTFEFNRISYELEKKAKEMAERFAHDDAHEAIRLLILMIETGVITSREELRAELDAVLRVIDRSFGSRAEKLVLVPLAQRIVDSADAPKNQRCHLHTLERAYDTLTADHMLKAGAYQQPVDRSPGDRRKALRLVSELDQRGQPERAVRALGSLADLSGPLTAAAMLADHPHGRALAIDLLRELVADAKSLRAPEQLIARRLLARSLVREGAPREAFELLAVPLRGAPRLRDDASYEDVLRHTPLRELADELRLVGAQWAADQPARRAEIARKVRSLAGQAFTSALVIDAFYTGTDPLELRVLDGDALIATHDYFAATGDIQATTLHLAADELPGALEVVGGTAGEWVRIDLFDATDPTIRERSKLVILTGPRTVVELPAHLRSPTRCAAPPSATAPTAKP